MSSQPDTSDDLIAELAKLMATNAKGEPSGAKTAAAPATASPASPSPSLQGLAGNTKPAVRIPGLDMPPLAVVPINTTTKSNAKPAPFEFKPMAPPPSQLKPGQPVPTIRIPGMDQPVPAAAAPKPATPPVMLTPAPTKPLVTAPEIRAVDMKAAPPRPAPAGTRIEPRIATPVPPPAAQPAQATRPAGKDEARKNGAAGPDFDFGFGTNDKAKDQEKHAPRTSYDPIAEIIAADLNDAERETVRPALKPIPVSASAPKPATVTPVVPLTPRSGQAAAPTAKLAPAAPVTLKPSFATKPVPPEHDKFFVAPVFGFGAKPSAPAATAPVSDAKPLDARRPGDPMDEIETLIGDAVRVGAEADREPLAQPELPPKPVVPPLTTNFAPRRTALKDEPDTAPQSAEAAILAAAAATGSEVGRIEPIMGEEPSRKKTKYRPKPARRPSTGARQYVGLAVAGTLLLAAGFGLYWVLNMGPGDPANAPLLTADASPVKEAAAVVASTEPKSPVLDQIDGVAASPAEETLVSRDDTEGEAVTEVAAVPDVTESGLANRKVRTVTVRPDGTIVEAEDSVAGAEPLPVDRPDVPSVPGQSLNPSDLLTAAANAASPDPIAAVIAESGGAADAQTATAETTAPDSLEVAAAQPPSPVTALALMPEGATATPSNVAAPAPMARPLDRAALNGQPSTSVNAIVEPDPGQGLALTAGGQQIDLLAPQQSEPAPQQIAVAAPTQPAGTASAYVQLSAQRDETTAKADARRFDSQFASLFGGNALEIHRVDLGAKGIWYRVMVPASSKGAANSICIDIKNAGGDCLIR